MRNENLVWKVHIKIGICTCVNYDGIIMQHCIINDYSFSSVTI